MAVKVISDLHGEVEAMQREVSVDDTLLLLGDLINIIDYHAMDGILVEIFGRSAVAEVVELRTAGRFDDARAVMAARRQGREDEIAATWLSLLRAEYERVFAATPAETLLILGNVDTPELALDLAPPNVKHVDGQVIVIGGRGIGFVGGGLPTPLHIAGEISEEEYNAKLDGLGEVDVVCSHVPPDIPELTYDIVAGRSERGSKHLLSYIRDVQPDKVLFGHIHQPVISSTHVGRTHVLNVGYFRRTKRAYSLF